MNDSAYKNSRRREYFNFGKGTGEMLIYVHILRFLQPLIKDWENKERTDE